MNGKTYTAVILTLLLSIPLASAVVIGQTDDFQDGTTMNWSNGEIIVQLP